MESVEKRFRRKQKEQIRYAEEGLVLRKIISSTEIRMVNVPK